MPRIVAPAQRRLYRVTSALTRTELAQVRRLQRTLRVKHRGKVLLALMAWYEEEQMASMKKVPD